MLNEYNFKSIFKNELMYFIKYKRGLGYDYINEVSRIRYIDNLLFEIGLKSKIITKDTFYKLIERNNKNEANYARQYYITKDFCIFLISLGYKKVYYDIKKFHIVNNYKPTMFNDDEIHILFKTMDDYARSYKGKKYYQLYYTYSILFRLLYACGLRLSEVIKINVCDIDFNQNTINIIDSKRHISRIVVFSKTMKVCLEKYIKLFNIEDGLVFKNYNNNKINHKIRKYYKRILSLANLNIAAHIHDLRHIYANKALNQMLERGYEENVVIVYLYKYMGHKTITETEYYLHFTDYNKKKIIVNNDAFSKTLYEGVDFNNE